MGFFDTLAKLANPINDILSPISSIVTTSMNNRQQERTNNANMAMNIENLKFNKEEAEKSRQFNAQQSALQNQFNADQARLAFDRSSAFEREMWKKENEYNTPKAQIERLQAAGLNPNLFGGDNTASSVGSASSPAAIGSPASGSPASAPSMIPMQSPPSMFNPLLEASQIALNKAQSEKIETDTNSEKIRQKYLDSIYQGNLDLNNVQIHLGLSQQKVNEDTADKILKESLRLDKEIQLCGQNLKNLMVQYDNAVKQGVLTDKEISAFDDRLKASIAQTLSETAKNYGLVNVSKKQCELLAGQITHQSIENGLIAIDFNKAFENAPASTGLSISAIQNEQSYYDWATGDWIDKIWRNNNASVPRKLWQTGSAYGNWLTHSIGVGLSGSFNAQPNVKKVR